MLPDIDKEVFSVLLDESSEGYYDWDMVGNKGYISPSLKKLFGYSEDEFTTLARIGEVHLLPAETYKAKDAFDKHVKSKGKIPYNVSLRFRHRLGNILHLQSKAKVISWTANNKPARVIGFYVNVTPYILTEEKIKRNNALLELIVDSINAGVWEWNTASGTHWWSERFYTLLGYNEYEVEPSYESFLQMLHPDDRKVVSNALENHLQHQEPYTLSVRIKCKNNEYRWFETTGKAAFDDESKPVRIAGSIIDIHKAKTAQLEIENSEFLLQQVGKLAHAGGWNFNVITNLLQWSRPVFDIYELPYDYIPVVEEALTYFEPASKELIAAKINDAISLHLPYDVELKLNTAKNRTIWVRAMGHPVFDKNEQLIGIQGIFQDIDSIKKSEEFFRQTNAQKDKLFSIISHDLRSPVSQTRMFIELMLRHKERYQISEKLLDLLITIKRNAENTYNLLDDLLAWSTNQFRQNSFVPRSLLFTDLLKRVLEQLEAGATEKNIQIHVKVTENFRLIADENMLKTIVRNLVSNAIKFSHKNGQIIVAASRKKGMTTITVQDFGVGIPKTDIDKLFNVTSNFTTYGTSMEKGTGLGLSFCKEFTEQHNGTISVISEPNKGSTFKIKIPETISKNN